MTIGCDISFSPSTDEFTKRIMFGNFMNMFDNSVMDAAGKIKLLAIKNIQSHLYPGHGFITGTLKGSYKGEVKSGGNGSANIKVFTDCFYAIFVEYGTYKMGARAHFRPGIQETEEEAEKLFAGAIESVIG